MLPVVCLPCVVQKTWAWWPLIQLVVLLVRNDGRDVVSAAT